MTGADKRITANDIYRFLKDHPYPWEVSSEGTGTDIVGIVDSSGTFVITIGEAQNVTNEDLNALAFIVGIVNNSAENVYSIMKPGVREGRIID